MDKVVRGGKVAVLISPDFGAGWYTWAQSEPKSRAVLFDPDVVAWVENGKVDPLPDMAKKHGLNYFYDGGANDLIIVWVDQGAIFRIHEYDGAESIVLYEEDEWIVA